MKVVVIAVLVMIGLFFLLVFLGALIGMTDVSNYEKSLEDADQEKYIREYMKRKKEKKACRKERMQKITRWLKGFSGRR